MNVVMLSPGFPLEMAYFTRALAQTGATVIGVGDQGLHALPPEARDHLAHYEHVSLADEGAVLAALHGLAQHARIDQVECLWEPYMVLAARIREDLGLPGMTIEQTLPFRDKELMKQVLDAAGIRTPRHTSTSTVQEPSVSTQTVASVCPTWRRSGPRTSCVMSEGLPPVRPAQPGRRGARRFLTPAARPCPGADARP